MTTNWLWPRIFAHRGAGRLAPENTLAALREGARLGARGLECDVKLTRDGVCALLHDDSLERTTDGHGPAAMLDWTDWARLDAGSWHSPAYAGEPPASLRAIAHACRALGHAINIEIKPCPGREAETGRVVAGQCAALWADAPLPPLLSSFSFEALLAARQAAVQLPRGWLVEAVPPDWHDKLQALDARALHCWHEALSAAQVAEIKAAGYAVFCYTVNTPARAQELFSWGVDALCTDYPDQLTPARCGIG